MPDISNLLIVSPVSSTVHSYMPLIITYGIYPYIKDWPQAMPKKAPLRGAFVSNISKRRCY